MTGMNLGAEEAAPIMAVRMRLKALERILSLRNGIRMYSLLLWIRAGR